MKVYILIHRVMHEGIEIRGVYASRDKAMEEAKAEADSLLSGYNEYPDGFGDSLDDFVIWEYEVVDGVSDSINN